MTQTAPAETQRPKKKTSPIAVLVFGAIVAFVGAVIVADPSTFGATLVAGWILLGVGGVLTTFGVIAAAVELGVSRALQR